MTNCNKPTFPLICNSADFSEPFHNTGELIYYQKIDPVHAGHVDGVVLLERNGNYYKAIYTENTINIEWYRCRYTDPLNDNDEAMITQAIKTASYLGATLRFDAREYIVNKQLEFEELSCFRLLGDKQRTIIKSNSKQRFSSYFLHFSGCNNFIIEGIIFDLNKRNLQVYTEGDWNNAQSEILRDFNGGIYVLSSTNIEIIDCRFYDLYTRAVQFYDCNGEIKICNNFFESDVQQQMYRMEHLGLTQSHNANFFVENNVFKNAKHHDPSKAPCGIFAFDCGYFGSVLIKNNYFEYCGRDNTGHHRLYAIDFYDNINNFIINSNIFRNTTWGAIRFDGTKKNGIISDNYIHQLIADDSGVINSSSRITIGLPKEFKNISIINNIIETSDERTYGILVQSHEDEIKVDNINIQNNSFNNVRTAVTIGGNINNINISNNCAANVHAVGIEYAAYSTTIITNPDNSTTTSPRLTSELGNALISNNNFKSAIQGDSFVGISIKSYTPTEAEVERVHELTKRFVISNNLIYGNGSNFGVVVDITTSVIPYGTSLDGRVTVSGNEISNVKSGLYLRCKNTIAKDNILFKCSVLPILEDPGANINLNNYYNNNPI
ncbi:hypothetical protein [Chryseobacterium indologenes]|uniref:hypothetical protein n=1 Tax=Chryseobacterium indologenes TaxID=253 RepID=UPI000B518E6D|nr:hypothetical protein [Chryseobacterium indologenes]ASE63820.1 hypothetical protein CEQ15_21220 [Chryseobacterium indologenes]TLX24471.1 hypothetical protein FE904_16595 [Chryseobacterium indologenes]VFA43459.1 Uncharacterised protein [Chryseobacterium indologenes]